MIKEQVEKIVEYDMNRLKIEAFYFIAILYSLFLFPFVFFGLIASIPDFILGVVGGIALVHLTYIFFTREVTWRIKK